MEFRSVYDGTYGAETRIIRTKERSVVTGKSSNLLAFDTHKARLKG